MTFDRESGIWCCKSGTEDNPASTGMPQAKYLYCRDMLPVAYRFSFKLQARSWIIVEPRDVCSATSRQNMERDLPTLRNPGSSFIEDARVRRLSQLTRTTGYDILAIVRVTSHSADSSLWRPSSLLRGLAGSNRKYSGTGSNRMISCIETTCALNGYGIVRVNSPSTIDCPLTNRGEQRQPARPNGQTPPLSTIRIAGGFRPRSSLASAATLMNAATAEPQSYSRRRPDSVQPLDGGGGRFCIVLVNSSCVSREMLRAIENGGGGRESGQPC